MLKLFSIKLKPFILSFFEEEKGSITVEATLVCSFIIFIIILLINMSIISFDKVIIQNEMSYEKYNDNINETNLKKKINKKTFATQLYNLNLYNLNEVFKIKSDVNIKRNINKLNNLVKDGMNNNFSVYTIIKKDKKHKYIIEQKILDESSS